MTPKSIIYCRILDSYSLSSSSFCRFGYEERRLNAEDHASSIITAWLVSISCAPSPKTGYLASCMSHKEWIWCLGMSPWRPTFWTSIILHAARIRYTIIAHVWPTCCDMWQDVGLYWINFPCSILELVLRWNVACVWEGLNDKIRICFSFHGNYFAISLFKTENESGIRKIPL